MRKRIYIACPIAKPATDDGLCNNVRQANDAMLALMKAGYSPFNPALSAFAGGVHQDWLNGDGKVFAAAHRYLNNEFTNISHTDWLSVDKAWVAVADAVLRLPGESKGADEETALANRLRIPVFTSIESLRIHFEIDPTVGPGKRTQGWWDLYFLNLAEQVSKASKDPSTRVGAVIADGKRLVSAGFNGFAQGCNDNPAIYADREKKLSRVVHGEVNAILFAGHRLDGCTLYTVPLPPCDRCAGIVIQSGIKRVVAPACPSEIRERWAKSLDSAEQQFREAGVTLDLLG